MSKLKFLILGHGRHGKDTFAEILRDEHGLTFMSSSQAANELIVYPVLKDVYNYKTLEECFDDRANHRTEWFDLILADEVKNPGRLTGYIFNKCNCYVGLRSLEAYEHCKKHQDIDAIIWIDRSSHLPPEDSGSFKLDSSYATHIIDNNGSLEELYQHTAAFMKKFVK